MEKVLLIDGNNLIFRSFYATYATGKIMRNSRGFPTNALYGLITTLNRIIEEEKPTHIMVAFDKGKTFRHEKYKDYKDGRKETPQELKEQFPLSREIVNAMGIECFEIDNYEADDIIGTFAKVCDSSDNYQAVIISSDKDLLQLISPNVEVRLLKSGDYIRMTEDEFRKVYGIDPIRMVDLKALMGDSSDNIVGVKGIGEKTALKLLKEHKTLDGIYENIDKIKGKVRENLESYKSDAYDSYYLATIYTKVDIDTNIDNIKYKGYDLLKYIEILEELEFNSILKKLNIPKEVQKEEIVDTIIISDMSEVKINDDFSLYLELDDENYHKAKPFGISIYNDKISYYIPFDIFLKDPDKVLLNDYLKYTFDLKKLIVILKRYNLSIKNSKYDLMMSLYLLNYDLGDDIQDIMSKENIDTLSTKELSKLNDIDVLIKNMILKAKYIYETKNKYLKELEKEEMLSLFNDIEMPLIPVLADMESVGIRVNKKYLEEMGVEIDEKILILEKNIFKLSGKEFNILSPKQLGEVLFIDLGIRYPKKVKDNKYSTSKDILDKLLDEHPIIDMILEYRNLSKLNSNYIKGLISEIHDDGRVHTIYKQNLTKTGRLSSVSPNLQNIPIRMDYGKLIRKAFVPDNNSILLSSDYSQIELRVFAHLSKSSHMIEAFKNNEDIHRKTASEIFNIPFNEVTSSQRSKAKAVNFGILYGISSFGLAWDLNIDFNEAKDFIDKYLELYPSITKYMNDTLNEARKVGYVKTLMNRKRKIPGLESSNYINRQAAERMAFNTPVQGSSADILKKAMIEIYDEFNKKNLKSKIILQVHDELVFNVLEDEEEIVKQIVKDIMENVYKLDVPLVTDIETGINWYDVK